jgi:hypothetical protein
MFAPLTGRCATAKPAACLRLFGVHYVPAEEGDSMLLSRFLFSDCVAAITKIGQMHERAIGR